MMRLIAIHMILSWSVAVGQMSSPQPIRIMPLGDSITHTFHGHASWRYLLFKDLEALGYNVDFVGSQNTGFLGATLYSDFDPDHEGHWGARADQSLGMLSTWLPAANPDIVLIHLGHNDLGQGQTPDSTSGEIWNIIQTCRLQNPNVVVLVAKIIPAMASWKPKQEELNNLLADIVVLGTTTQSPLHIVDQWTGFIPQIHTYDGVHPNTIGERMMAGRWLEQLTPVLGTYELGLRTAPNLVQSALMMTGGIPGDLYFTTWSLDPANVTSPGAGSWYGLHIDPVSIQVQLGVGLPYNLGVLDGFGQAIIPITPTGLTAIQGLAIHAVSVTINPTSGLESSWSPVRTWTL